MSRTPNLSAGISAQRNLPAGLQNRWVQARPAQGRLPAASAEYVATFTPVPGETLTAYVDRLAAGLKPDCADVLLVLIYGAVAAYDTVLARLREQLGGIDWPVFWVGGAGCRGDAIAGAQAFLRPRSQARIERITVNGQVIGTIFDDGDARHCLLGGLCPADPAATRPAQTAELFAAVQLALQQADFTFGDLARTWFYNDDILAWYDEFNRVRTGFYAGRRFTSGSLPASTGISAGNPRGAALTFGGWAVIPGTANATVGERASPLQCPAPAYGSSFSRAMEIVSGGRQRLLISGTASIEPGGRTVWLGDTHRQIDLTMQVVEAILQARGLDLGDTVRATAYFKHAADAPLLSDWLARHDCPALPVVPVHCDICRDDLLFEIELDACVET